MPSSRTKPSVASVEPSEIATARRTSGTPVTFVRNGTVRELRGELDDATALAGEEVLRGVHRVRVARVHAGALDVFHDPGDQRVDAVGDRIDLDLLATQVFVDEHASGPGLERRVEVALQVLWPVH